jgi:hypothetical protein
MNTKAPRKTSTAKSNTVILKDLPLELLTPEQFEAVTRANYHHAESRLILYLFLHTNHLWQLARKIQNNPAMLETINWASIEKNTARCINETLDKLLTGVVVAKPDTVAAEPPKRRRKLACGCASHSNAAGVVEACMLGKQQGQDERWTGH